MSPRTMPSMTTSRVGDVVSVECPITDMQGRKRRPGIVLPADASNLLLARITTHEPLDSFVIIIEDWAAIGLPKPSTARLLKPVSVDARPVNHSVGALSVGDRTTLAQAPALPAVPTCQWSEPTPLEAVRGFLPALGDCFVFLMSIHAKMHLCQVSAWRRVQGLGRSAIIVLAK